MCVMTVLHANVHRNHTEKLQTRLQKLQRMLALLALMNLGECQMDNGLYLMYTRMHVLA